MDGNEVTAYISYAFTEAAVLFPITPSTPMSEFVEEWAEQKRKNVFGYSVAVRMMESEAGVAGSMHGMLKSGVLTTTYTCSQGLLLMMPSFYKMVGELLPAVVHVSARAISTSALNIYGDHSDVMSLRPTGAVMLASGSVQEAALFSATAHLVAMRGRLPVIHFFDGFDTSHELRKVQLPTYEQLKSCLDEEAVDLFKAGSLSNFTPKATGVAQLPDLYFQQREAANLFYFAIEKMVEETIQKLNPFFGTTASSVEYFGSPDAMHTIVIMGSAGETVKQVVKRRNQQGEKVGVIVIHLYRPFPKHLFLKRLPQTVRRIAVLDRTKEPGSTAEPLMLDVKQICKKEVLIGGRYGLGGKQTTQEQIHAVFDELKKQTPKNPFTIGLIDDVMGLSLDVKKGYPLCMVDLHIQIWGFGSDGSVIGTRDFLKVIGEETTNDVQAHFYYSPHKSRGLTKSYIRIDQAPIWGAYTSQLADILICNQVDYLRLYDIAGAIKNKGTLLINTQYTETDLNLMLPAKIKQQLINKNIHLYVISADVLAQKYHLGGKINTILITCLFNLTKLLCVKNAIMRYKQLLLKHDFMKIEVHKKRVYQAIDESGEYLQLITLRNVIQEEISTSNEMIPPILKLEMTTKDVLINGLADGSFPLGGSLNMPTVLSEKLPYWKKDMCKQCNLCTLICPHSAIRPYLLNKEEQKKWKPTSVSAPFNKNSNYEFRIQIIPEKCTGCGLCVEICPASTEKALIKRKASMSYVRSEQENWNYLIQNNSNSTYQFNKQTCKSISFSEPLCAFSGACAGCGETPYAKLLTQLFGERLSIANATGCSMIWGASAPYISYFQSKDGMGPTWASSLFENNSAYGYGMNVGHELIRAQCYQQLANIASDHTYPRKLQVISKQIIEEDGKVVNTITAFLALCEDSDDLALSTLCKQRQFLLNRTQWIIGGDGWAYDIDSGGLDHLLFSNENINVLILDNEGYANTGGQLSKGTPTAAKIKFSSSGNKRKKKDFGFMTMQHDDVYVAQVAFMANPSQTLKAFREAEAYDGVSVIIAYVPCTIQKRKDSSLASSKKAVASGYWPLYRFNPMMKKKMYLESPAPNREKLKTFLQDDGRFTHSDEQDDILDELDRQARKRYFKYQLIEKLAEVGGDL